MGVQLGSLRLQTHAYVEAGTDGISQEVIATAGRASELLEEYPDRPEGLSKPLLAYGPNDEAVHVVVNVAAFEDDPAEPVVVVTVYKPEPPWWLDERTRR